LAQIGTDRDLDQTLRRDAQPYPHEDVTREIIAAAYEVHRVLGGGFLERVYENALVIELAKRGLRARVQVPIVVRYNDQPVGEYFADVLVNDVVICEIKAAAGIAPGHQAQLLNYLKATSTKVGLLLNFGVGRVQVQTDGILDVPSVDIRVHQWLIRLEHCVSSVKSLAKGVHHA
jgi:GxxExxY protein